MKKAALLIALIYLLIGLTACMPEETASPDQTNSTGTPATSTKPSTQPQASTSGSAVLPLDPPAVSLSEIPLSSLSTPIVQEAFYAEDGTLILTYTYQNIFPIHQDVAVAEAVNLAMLNDLDRSTDLQQVLQQARDDYAASPTRWQPYQCQVLFDTLRLDQNVLSIFGDVTHTTKETSSSPISATYSLIDGRKLSFKDVQSDGYSYYALFKLIDAALKQTVSADQLLSEYKMTIQEQLSSDSSNWYLSETGLCFYYSPYEVAAKAAGTIVVEIPYSELAGILKDDFFPAEEYITGGSLHVQPFSQANIFAFQNFAEIIQDSDGEEVLLYTDGTITDLRFEVGSWNTDDMQFVPAATIFACDGIWESSAVLLQIQFPDAMPSLRVSYSCDGTSYTKYLTQSGKDGSFILTNF